VGPRGFDPSEPLAPSHASPLAAAAMKYLICHAVNSDNRGEFDPRGCHGVGEECCWPKRDVRLRWKWPGTSMIYLIWLPEISWRRCPIGSCYSRAEHQVKVLVYRVESYPSAFDKDDDDRRLCFSSAIMLLTQKNLPSRGGPKPSETRSLIYMSGTASLLREHHWNTAPSW
jgi:hypothetical protein